MAEGEFTLGLSVALLGWYGRWSIEVTGCITVGALGAQHGNTIRLHIRALAGLVYDLGLAKKGPTWLPSECWLYCEAASHDTSIALGVACQSNLIFCRLVGPCRAGGNSQFMSHTLCSETRQTQATSKAMHLPDVNTHLSTNR